MKHSDTNNESGYKECDMRHKYVSILQYWKSIKVPDDTGNVNKYYMLHTYKNKRMSIHSILTMIENQIRGRRSSAKESIVFL